MTNERMDEAEDSIYAVDVKQTFYANFLWLWMTLIVLVFLVVAVAEINGFTGVERLLYMIILLFTFVKLLGWLHSPRLMLKLKNKEKIEK